MGTCLGAFARVGQILILRQLKDSPEDGHIGAREHYILVLELCPQVPDTVKQLCVTPAPYLQYPSLLITLRHFSYPLSSALPPFNIIIIIVIGWLHPDKDFFEKTL